ncbi:MAG TPA: hypothetical protein VFS43_00255 [Polyangiaceae bacterium]|nr:hypothetical protein [Polyangiaceae bacterium]
MKTKPDATCSNKAAGPTGDVSACAEVLRVGWPDFSAEPSPDLARRADVVISDAEDDARWSTVIGENMLAGVVDAERAALWCAWRAYVAASDGEAGAKLRALAVDAALEFYRAGDPIASTPEARAALALALRRLALDVYRRARPFGESGAAELKDGEPIPIDAAAIGVMGATGPEGAANAKEAQGLSTARARAYLAARPGDLAGAARGLVSLWTGKGGVADVPRYLVALARAAWRDFVRRGVADTLERAAALTPHVYDQALRMHSPGRRLDVTEGGGRLLFRDKLEAEINQTALVNADLLTVIQRGQGQMGTMTAIKVFRWEVFEGWRRHMRGLTNKNVIELVGGWKALCEQEGIELNPKKHAADVRAIVLAQAHLRFNLPGGWAGNLLSYSEHRAKGQASSLVVLTLNQILMPGYAEELERLMGSTGLEARQARRLVPMLRTLPPFVGRGNDYGSQAAFAMGIVAEFRAHAAELYERGDVELTLPKLADIGDRHGVPRSLAPRVIAGWTGDGDDAFLWRRDRGGQRYTLGAPYAVERAFLESAGKREVLGAAGGRASARKRLEALARHGRAR